MFRRRQHSDISSAINAAEAARESVREFSKNLESYKDAPDPLGSFATDLLLRREELRMTEEMRRRYREFGV